jgi:hypothetical protein
MTQLQQEFATGEMGLNLSFCAATIPRSALPNRLISRHFTDQCDVRFTPENGRR